MGDRVGGLNVSDTGFDRTVARGSCHSFHPSLCAVPVSDLVCREGSPCFSETTTERMGDGMLNELTRDLRFGLRTLARSPGFATVAMVIIALGIGATTAIFSVADAVLLEPLPFHEPDRLMRPSLVMPPGSHGPMAGRDVVWSIPKYEVFRSGQSSFSATAMHMSYGTTLTGEGAAERVAGELVESGYLEVLGVVPVLGRSFTAEDDRLVLLSHGVWLRRWGGDPAVVGQTATLSGSSYTVVGVLPRGFKGLSGRAEVFRPLSILDEADRTGIWSHSFFVVARLKEDVAPEQAHAEMEIVGRRIDEAFPTTNASLQGWGATARTFDELRADPRLKNSILLLLGAGGVVLLISCVNLANLLLARGSSRRREMAIRAALGSGRTHLIRQLMVESLVLATGGATLGLMLGFIGVEAVRSLGPGVQGVVQGNGESLATLGLANIAVDGRILMFTVVLALGTCTLFGLVPALRTSRPDLVGDLKEGTGWRAGSRRIGRVTGRDVLVLAEIALAFVLLSGSGLTLRSLQRLGEVDLGFESESTLTASLAISGYEATERETFFTELLERIRAIPGVQAAGLGSCPPVSGGCSSTAITFFDRPQVEAGTEPSVDIHSVGTGFFEALDVPLIRGRTFDERDRLGEARVVVLSERAANEYWPGEDPIGRTVGLGQGPGFWEGAEVVGIVGDVHFRSVESLPGPTTYIPFSQAIRRRGYLFVRARGDAIAIAGSVRRAVSSIDADVPVTDVRTMKERVAAATVRTRLSASLLSLFAAVALTLSSVGVFGVLSYLVAQRTREIGIRMALGAQRGTVFWQVLRGGLVTTALGIVIGGVTSLGLMRLMGSLLFEVGPEDPTTLAAVALSLSAASLAAAYLPARRATRVQPIEALRNR